MNFQGSQRDPWSETQANNFPSRNFCRSLRGKGVRKPKRKHFLSWRCRKGNHAQNDRQTLGACTDNLRQNMENNNKPTEMILSECFPRTNLLTIMASILINCSNYIPTLQNLKRQSQIFGGFCSITTTKEISCHIMPYHAPISTQSQIDSPKK